MQFKPYAALSQCGGKEHAVLGGNTDILESMPHEARRRFRRHKAFGISFSFVFGQTAIAATGQNYQTCARGTVAWDETFDPRRGVRCATRKFACNDHDALRTPQPNMNRANCPKSPNTQVGRIFAFRSSFLSE